MSNWQRLDSRIAYQNPYITVHEDNVIRPDGKEAAYGWVETPPAVFVVAVDSEDKVLLVKQARYTTGQPTWELPGGNSDGRDALDAAKAELEEEAGLHADDWAALSGEYYVWGGVATQRNTVVIAKGLHKARAQHGEADDLITESKAFSWDELKDMIKSAELNDGESITALTVAGLHLGHLK